VNLLDEHPLNRNFATTGEEWDDFCASVKEHGVVESLFVRPMGKRYEVLAGHRRLAAARQVGLGFVPCQVVEMDDRAALVFLINSNLQRLNLDIIQEAELVRELAMMGLSDEQILQDLSRETEWLEVRQMVFAFDFHVIDALKKGILSEGAFREVLWAPAPIRDRAVAVVMGGGEQHDEPLSAERAREFIQYSLIPEWEKETEWEDAIEKTRKAVTKEMKKLTGTEGTVLVLPWGKGSEGLGGDLVDAKALVPVEAVADGKDHGKNWALVAVAVGTTVYVVATDMTHREKRLLVSRRVLMDDAAARAAAGMEPLYLAPKEKAKKSEAVAAAVAVLDGEGEKSYDESEPVAKVATSGEADGIKIEQSMDHSAWVDLGAVRRVAMWAINEDSDPQKAPDWLPEWARELAMEGRWSTIDAVVNWVQSLKK